MQGKLRSNPTAGEPPSGQPASPELQLLPKVTLPSWPITPIHAHSDGGDPRIEVILKN